MDKYRQLHKLHYKGNHVDYRVILRDLIHTVAPAGQAFLDQVKHNLLMTLLT
jgi:hypothetical protein